jgi:hypothetical protein
MTSLLKNINNGARKFTGFKNNVSIKFPFVTVFYLFLYITFNLINKNESPEKWKENNKIRFYDTLKKANMLYFYPYIRAIGDGHFYNYGFKKTGGFIMFIILISCISLINEFLVGHKLLLLFMLVAVFNLYFSDLEKETTNDKEYIFSQPTKSTPYCCGSGIYTFLMGSGIIALFSKMTHYKGRILVGILLLLAFMGNMYYEYSLSMGTKMQKYKDNNKAVPKDIKKQFSKESRMSKVLLQWHTHFFIIGCIVGLLTTKMF